MASIGLRVRAISKKLSILSLQGPGLQRCEVHEQSAREEPDRAWLIAAYRDLVGLYGSTPASLWAADSPVARMWRRNLAVFRVWGFRTALQRCQLANTQREKELKGPGPKSARWFLMVRHWGLKHSDFGDHGIYFGPKPGPNSQAAAEANRPGSLDCEAEPGEILEKCR